MEEYRTPIIKITTVSDSVYNWIKNAIISGTFKPGEHIVQEDLTKKLGVSRTPVRDAIARLQTEGLIIVRPHAGAVVAKFTKEGLEEIYEIRILIEQFCLRRSCLKVNEDDIKKIEQINIKMLNAHSINDFMALDREFHMTACGTSKCENALSILNDLMNKCDSFKSIYYSTQIKRDKTISEHAQIIDAIKNHNIPEVESAISHHLKDVEKTVRETLHFQNEQ